MVRTAISVLVLFSATAFAQQSAVTTINNVRNSLNSATSPLEQQRNAAIRQATGATTASTANIPSRAVTPAPQPVSPADSQETRGSGKTTRVMRGKRDPFVSIIRTESVEGRVCAAGKKCLVIGQVELKGIVRSAAGTIAVVENAQRKTYFLRENDPVFNGRLVRIAADHVVFRETVVDRVGRQSSRDIVKRIVKPAV
ncbi:MAG TPA: hypothetical protein VD837_18810 [Terriglobales bacterium]|nr:hypothetical protein [Terriglobales bacterium]